MRGVEPCESSHAAPRTTSPSDHVLGFRREWFVVDFVVSGLGQQVQVNHFGVSGSYRGASLIRKFPPP